MLNAKSSIRIQKLGIPAFPKCWRGFCLALGMALAAGCGPKGPDLLQEGVQLLDAGKDAEAIAKLTEASVLLPENALLWNQLGLAYHRSGKFGEALESYQKAKELDQNLSTVRFNLGLLKLEQNLPAEAVGELTSYTILEPQDLEGWRLLGRAHLRIRDFEGARQAYAKAYEMDSRDPEILNALGMVQVQRNRPTEASKLFQAAIEYKSNHGPALRNLAYLQETYFTNYTAAVRLYRDFLANSPEPTPETAEARESLQRLEGLLQAAAARQAARLQTNAIPKAIMTTQAVAQANQSLPQPAIATNTQPVLAESNPTTITSNQTQKASAEEVASPAATTNQTVEVRIELPPPPILPTELVNPFTNAVVVVDATSPAPEATPTSMAPLLSELPLSAGSFVNPMATPPAPPPPAAPSIPPADTATTLEPGILPGPAETIEEAPEKPGFFQRLNPMKWFGDKEEKKPTPLPARWPETSTTPSQIQPVDSSSPAPLTELLNETAPPPVSAPVIHRYTYLQPATPASGDRAKASPLYNQAVTAQTEGRLGEAIEQYREALRWDPSYFEAYYNLGWAEYQQEDIGKALTVYEYALSLRPDSARARFNFALALNRANYPLDAAAEWERYLAMEPDSDKGHLVLGDLYASRLGDIPAARRHYSRVLEIRPDHPAASRIRYWLAAHPETP